MTCFYSKALKGKQIENKNKNHISAIKQKNITFLYHNNFHRNFTGTRLRFHVVSLFNVLLNFIISRKPILNFLKNKKCFNHRVVSPAAGWMEPVHTSLERDEMP